MVKRRQGEACTASLSNNEFRCIENLSTHELRTDNIAASRKSEQVQKVKKAHAKNTCHSLTKRI